MKSFNGRGRIRINGKNTASRAEELAEWLSKQPFCGLPQKPENVTGAEWEMKINGRTGIVYFANYWRRTEEGANSRSGDHIDLWNGSRLTATRSSFFSTLGRRIGINDFFPGTDYGYSDLRRATEILFWEVK